MLAASENYKGIKFVRVSSLPVDQKNAIWESINHRLVIKILKDEALLNDCIQYHHYTSWYDEVFNTAAKQKSIKIETTSDSLAIAS